MTKFVHQIKASHGPPYPSFGVMFLVNVKKLWITCKIRISQGSLMYTIIAMNRTFLQQSRLCNVILTSLKTNNINLFTSSLFFTLFIKKFLHTFTSLKPYTFCFQTAFMLRQNVFKNLWIYLIIVFTIIVLCVQHIFIPKSCYNHYVT